LNESRPLAAFAGIWTHIRHAGVRLQPEELLEIRLGPFGAQLFRPLAALRSAF
jgi:hypothetical protein